MHDLVEPVGLHSRNVIR